MKWMSMVQIAHCKIRLVNLVHGQVLAQLEYYHRCYDNVLARNNLCYLCYSSSCHAVVVIIATARKLAEYNTSLITLWCLL